MKYILLLLLLLLLLLISLTYPSSYFISTRSFFLYINLFLLFQPPICHQNYSHIYYYYYSMLFNYLFIYIYDYTTTITITTILLLLLLLLLSGLTIYGYTLKTEAHSRSRFLYALFICDSFLSCMNLFNSYMFES